jgi:hypothetical protein
MKLQKFKIKDIVFLAIMAALLFLCSAVAMPLMSISLFGLRNMATAVFYGAFVTLALMKVRKPGALTLLGFFNSVILLMMSPVMFITNTVSAFITELIALTIFKSYEGNRAIYLAASLMIPVTLPFTAVFSVIMNGVSFSQVIGDSLFVILTCLGTVLLSILGAFIGSKIGKELKKAGKI